jgi:CheY-like chemotaxis protein
VVHESLRIGGRPDSAIAEETDGGEVIEVRTRSPKGDAIVKFVDWKVESSVPDEMVIDERDLAKLISVLFLNALKFTENGRISLVVSLSRNSRYVVINVTDTGLGIPAGFRPNLFKAFSREDDSIRRHSEGLGLGLLVAKGLARRTGGDLICVRSETEGPQRGSEFELKVPLSPCDGASRQSTPSRTPTPSCAFDKPAALGLPEFRTFALNRQRTPSKSSPKLGPTDVAAEEPRSQLRPPTPSGSENDATPGRRLSAIKSMTYDRTLASKHPLTFLVAEDNRINRKLLVSMLAKLGYGTVYEAYDGVEAVRLMELNLAEEAGDRVDVILMDLWMPNMDGYEAAERILALESQRATAGGAGDVATGTPCRGVKILAVTADVTDEALERTRATGMMGFMTKPYKMLDLERLIVEHCSTGRV